MPLHFEADLAITIDGQAAHLRGSGRTLTLAFETPWTIRKLLQISLPNLAQDDRPNFAMIPDSLAHRGLTLILADQEGPLLVLGKEAEGKRYDLPFIGEIRHVALANKQAALRLVFNA